MLKDSVFISGSAGFGRRTSFDINSKNDLSLAITGLLDKYMQDGKVILIGDCPGVDSAVQGYLLEKNYKSVIIYHSGCRIRIKKDPDWKDITVPVPPGVSGREFYTVKDKALCEDCESGLALWDGYSKGTKRNIRQLAENSKEMTVYRIDLRRFQRLDEINN